MNDTRRRILSSLSDTEAPTSGEALARELGISRAAVWKHIAALKAAGYEIESEHARGYRILAQPEAFNEERIAERLSTGWLGHRIVYSEVTESTNSDAAALGREGAAHGTVVVADRQTAGRGRLGRSWESAPGVNLYLSVLLRPSLVPADAPQLSLVAGVAVSRALEEQGLAARIKWPNDVIVSGRKVSGILTEIEAEADRVSFVVVGIGVNLNSRETDFPAALRPRATSLFIEQGRQVDRAAFSAQLLAAFERAYETFDTGGFAAVRRQWEARTDMIGRKVVVDGPGRTVEGICRGIAADGALRVEGPGGRELRVIAGDVTLLGGYE